MLIFINFNISYKKNSILTGFFCLNRVRKSLNNDEDNKQKLANFMLRIGIFSLLFIVPQVIYYCSKLQSDV